MDELEGEFVMKKQLTLNKNNATISERMNEIYIKEWDIDVKVARDTLRKMYYGECDKRMSVEDHRLILHNLVCSELEAHGITNSAKLWAKALLDYLNNEPEYVKHNAGEYGKAINNYLETHKSDMTKYELIDMYERYYEIFKNYEYKENGTDDEIKQYLEKMISKFNLNLIKGNFNIVLDIIEDVLIHNNNYDCNRTLNSFIGDVRNTDIETYKKILLLLKQYEEQIKIS